MSFHRGPGDLLLPVRGLVVVELDQREVFRSCNLFLNAGYGRLAQFLAGQAPTPPSYIAVGNGDGTAAGAAVTPAAADTVLSFELLRKTISSQSVLSTYTARLVSVFSTTEVQRQLTEVGLCDLAGDNGTATGAGQTTTKLVDTSKAWTTNQWAGWMVYITNAADGDATKKSVITSNDATSLTLTSALTTAPVAATTTYTIGGVGSSSYLFARASIAVNKGAQNMSVIWQLTLPSA